MSQQAAISTPTSNDLLLPDKEQVRQHVLDYLYARRNEGYLHMNDLLKTFHLSNLKDYVAIFGKLESSNYISCKGNYGWLGSKHEGEFVDLSHPLSQFTCKLLPDGIDMVETNIKMASLEAIKQLPVTKPQQKIYWYQHWIFWLIIVAVFMISMISFVEVNYNYK